MVENERPEAVVRALQVLEVRERVERERKKTSSRSRFRRTGSSARNVQRSVGQARRCAAASSAALKRNINKQ